jgi:hypothetical protein
LAILANPLYVIIHLKNVFWRRWNLEPKPYY